LEIRKIAKTIKEPTNQISCHEIEPNPSKNRAMHEGDNPSFLDEFIKITFFLKENHQQFSGVNSTLTLV
jgi:hypothetical protein